MIDKLVESGKMKLDYKALADGRHVLTGPHGGIKFILEKDKIIINNKDNTANSVATLFGIKNFNFDFDAQVKSKPLASVAGKNI